VLAKPTLEFNLVLDTKISPVASPFTLLFDKVKKKKILAQLFKLSKKHSMCGQSPHMYAWALPKHTCMGFAHT